jgi:hypothetical protein
MATLISSSRCASSPASGAPGAITTVQVPVLSKVASVQAVSWAESGAPR